MGARLHAGRWAALAAVLAFSILLIACSEDFSSPQNTFAPEGTVAEDQKNDFLLVMWPALVIGVAVMLGLVLIAIRFRRKKGDPGLPKQVHGNTPLELGWTIAPAILLAVIAVPTVLGVQDLGREARDNPLQVNVIGQRFLWQFEYPELGTSPDQPLLAPIPETGIPELRIPVGREIGVHITSIDVNHSFWVPKLAGKTDAIQNHPNRMWIEATSAGTFEGQCAEFCGLEHANMRLRVIAMPQAEFDDWIAEQQTAARARESGEEPRVGVAAEGE
jgi:cytochrome c oxidase subunit 2